MKICYIAKSSFPSFNASSLQIVRMCENFSLLKNQVFLIAPDSGLINIDFKSFYNIKNNFYFIKLSWFNKFPLNFNSYLYSIFAVIYSLKLKPNLYITRNIVISFILFLFKKKQIIEIHHDAKDEGRISHFILKFFNYLNNSSIIKVVVISKNLKYFYKEVYGVKENKIQIISSATNVKPKKFSFRNLADKNQLNIGYFGSFLKSKGVQLILNLSNIDKNNKYFIIGGDKNLVSRKKNQFSSRRNLILISHLPHHKAINILSKMDILLLPFEKNIRVAGNVGDISDFTSPLKLFDYFSCGKVIISSEINVLKDVLKNKLNCIFVKNFLNPRSWLGEINKIKNNNFQTNLISKNSLITARQNSYLLRVKKFLE